MRLRLTVTGSFSLAQCVAETPLYESSQLVESFLFFAVGKGQFPCIQLEVPLLWVQASQFEFFLLSYIQ